MKNIKLNLGKKIKLLRKKNMTSVHELSEMFAEINNPVSVKTIYKWESGENIPDLNTLTKLSYLFNTSMSYFISNYKYFQALTDTELEFISKLRMNKVYKKVITLIGRNDKGGIDYE